MFLRHAYTFLHVHEKCCYIYVCRQKAALFKDNDRHNRSSSCRGSAFIQFMLPLPKLESKEETQY